MKKKLSIVFIIVFLILVGALLTISKHKNDEKSFQIQNNEMVFEDEIVQNKKEENVLENIIVEEKIEVSDEKENEKVESIEKKENKTENQTVSEKNKTSASETNNKANNKVNNKETTTKKNTTTTTVTNNTNSTSKNEEKKEQTTTEKPKQDIVKEEKPTTNKPTTNNTKTEEIIETPKCKHSNENYYNTEEEAIAFYKKTSKEYGDKVKSGEITYEEYLKKCPYGYETMSCPYCQKWTISFYYE